VGTIFHVYPALFPSDPKDIRLSSETVPKVMAA
jgi:hypothetical protein